MQKAVGYVNVPDPELETELQEEVARIEPKISQGTVTKAEANHLHSLEARAHGHTEKGGVTAIAQSVVAKRERKMSLSSGSSLSHDSVRSRADGKASTMTPHEQSHHDLEVNLHQAEVSIRPKIEQETVTQADAKRLQSLEARAHGNVEKGGIAASAQSLISKRRNGFLSDRSNVSPRTLEAEYERRKEQSQHDKDLNLKSKEPAIASKTDEENMSKGHSRENSQPVAEHSY